MEALAKSKSFFITFYLILVSFLLSYPCHAKSKKSFLVQKGIVNVDGAAVYKNPNFDAPVIHYFKRGDKILMTTKIYPGVAGFGAFYKVRLDKKKFGYITDIEVIPQYQKVGSSLKRNDEFKNFSIKQKTQHLEDIYISRYIGVTGSWVGLAEKWGKKSFTKFIPFFGVKLTGPGFISEQFPWDFEILYNHRIPKFYRDIPLKNNRKVASAKGYNIQSQLIFNIPLSQTIFQLIYAGFGPTFIFRSLVLEISESNNLTKYQAQQLRSGFAFQFGFSRRLADNFLIRAEARYHMEESRYVSTALSIQRTF